MEQCKYCDNDGICMYMGDCQHQVSGVWDTMDACGVFETKKTKYHISDMDIIFEKELTQEEMEKLFFSALQSIGAIGHRGCPR